MKFQIKDFTDRDPIEVEPLFHDGKKYVLITQRGGSMSFQHSMRPDQAAFLASALQMAAEEVEQMAVKANTLEAQP